MPVNYISTEDAITASGIRMTVVSAVPSPWAEAAKGILHVKGLSWQAVRYDSQDNAQLEWAKYPNAPTLVLDDQAPINGWRNILEFAEAAAPKPTLLPAAHRDICLALSDDFCGTDGFAWHRRLLGIHTALTGGGGFPPSIAQYLGQKYGYSREAVGLSVETIAALVAGFVKHLKSQKAAGHPYYVGDSLTCVDIYSACFMAMFVPLPEDQCAMHPKLRLVYEHHYPDADRTFDPILIEHRDYIYANYLELPLSL